MSKTLKFRGVILLSGGLDSILAAHILNDMGVDLIAVNFTSPFHPRCAEGEINPARLTAGCLSIVFRQVELGYDIIDIIKDPPHGYGKNLNPCIDCRIRQLKIAKKIMQKEKGSIIATGEVLGQRPMSQNRNSLEIIEKTAGVKGVLLRPLSARLLPVTEAEKEGQIDRTKLFAMEGRQRKEQFNLAEKFNINEGDYLPAAGGCRLTNKEYAAKIRDLKEHDNLNMVNVRLANKGRHFRFTKNFKLIVGRDEKENILLQNLAPEDALIITPAVLPGPLAVGIGDFTRKELLRAASVCAYYTDKESKNEIKFKYCKGRIKGKIDARPIRREEIEGFRIA